jgi:O-Antigen ligase
MYLEVVFALALGMLVTSIDRRQRARAFASVVAVVLIAEGIILTLTRAGLVSMAVATGVVTVWRVRMRGIDAAVRAIGVVAVLIVAMFAASRPAQSIWLRLTSQGQENWYRSSITPPDEIRFAAGEIREIPIRVTNTGRVTWDSGDSPPFYFSYHWLEPTADRVVAFEGTRTAFATPVAPAETTTVRANVRAPNQAGRYRIAWDIVQEGRLWFSTEPGATLTVSLATVRGSAVGARPATTALPLPAERPGRWLLWSSALRLIAAHPVLGVGPDNFRLLYGPYAGLRHPDSRMHSNNMYLEVVVGSGLLGALACGWLVWRIAAQAAAALRKATRDELMPASIGVPVAVIAIGLHGLVDSFLSFTPTYVLIALTLAFVHAGGSSATAGTHADRV